MDQLDDVAGLLREASETHGQVFRLTDGEDPDWASWYAKWLIELSELPDLVGSDLVPSHLVYELVRLDRDYNQESPEEAWEMYYARQLIDVFASEFEDAESDELDDDEDDLDDFDLDDEEDDEEFDFDSDDEIDVTSPRSASPAFG